MTDSAAVSAADEQAAKEARKQAAREAVNQGDIRAELCAVVYHGRGLGE